MSTSPKIETPAVLEVAVEAAPAVVSETPATAGSTTELTPTAPTKEAADTLIAEGKKAIALKQWEEGVAKYADALDIMRGIVGDQDPTMAPLLLSYGKALFELAVSQSGVMGKEEAPKEVEDDDEPGPSNLIESADPEIMAEAEAAAADGGEDVPDEPEPAPEGQEAGDEEPEDDYNAAWEVLDVARGIYTRVIEDAQAGTKGKGKETEEVGGEVKHAQGMLADCYQTLGDISCETENFQQAVSDYTSALDLLTPHYPPSSRILASLHFTLGTALEFLPLRRADALTHVQAALSSFLARQEDLQRPVAQMSNPDLAKLSEKDREAEKKEVGELIGDLEVKVEELKAAPEGEGLVEEGIRHLVGGGGSEGAFGASSGAGKKDDGPVNDLSGMVKKKKKPAAVVPAPVQAGSGSGSNGAGVVAEATKMAETVKDAVVAGGEKAAAVVEASVVGSTGQGEKRAAEVEDEERDSKRAKAE